MHNFFSLYSVVYYIHFLFHFNPKCITCVSGDKNLGDFFCAAAVDVAFVVEALWDEKKVRTFLQFP